MDPKKIEAMKDFPGHKTLKSLHGFLCLIGYYRNFVKNYGKTATPLTFLLKNNAFSWTHVAIHSFHAFKEAMCTNPIPVLPYFTKKFFL
jgi:hypothetical protein